ncbi:MAG: hypothetical protein KF841_11865 [Phycisphaerae bacterium]|nr:hypothetical protein [Phycisphaerae bacterium]
MFDKLNPGRSTRWSLRRDNPGRVVRLAVLCGLSLVIAQPEFVAAQGGRRSSRPREKRVERARGSSFKIEPYGLELHEPLVGECLELLESGNLEEAVQKLESAIAEWPRGANLEPLNELRLGLGLCLLRAGQTKSALKSYLNPLGRMRNGSSVVPRAKLTWAICQRMGPPVEGRIPLQSPESWEQYLLQAAKQRGEELVKAHAERARLVEKGLWKKLNTIPDKTTELWEQVYCVRTADMEREGPPIARAHMEALADQVNLVNDQIDAGVRQLQAMRAVAMQPAIVSPPRGRRFRRQAVAPAPIDKQKYNRICQEVREAWKFGNSLVSKYRALEAQEPYGLTIPADVRMRIPQGELPRPMR